MPIKGDFEILWKNYPKGFQHDHRLPRPVDDERIKQLGIKLQNDLGKDFKEAPFTNLCAVRVSLALNAGGMKIPKNVVLSFYKKDEKGNDHRFLVKEAANGEFYGIGSVEFSNYITQKFGKPDLEFSKVGNQDDTVIEKALEGKKGILFFAVERPKIWIDADGHITLWNGQVAADNAYFKETHKVKFWEVVKPLTGRSVRIRNLNDAIRIIARPIAQDSGQ